MIARKLKSRAVDFARRILNRRAYMESTFARLYTDNLWGNAESVSGPGSTLNSTIKLRSELPLLLAELGAKTMLDAPCGDFNWIKETDLRLEQYTGVDVVPDIIARNRKLYGNERTTFLVRDLTRDELPCVDVILCRDCFIHLSYRRIVAAIRNFKRSRSTYLLTNTYPLWRSNKNINTGDFRFINLMLPPFDFPPSIRQINEKFPEQQTEFFGKTLELWRLSDL
jgi:SAM-dependent methyltransferase